MELLFFAMILACPPLCIFYAVLGFIMSPKNWRSYLPFFIYFIFMIVCALELGPQASNKDLIRYYVAMDTASSFSSFESYFNYYDRLDYSMMVLYWILGNIGVHQFLPAMSISIVIFTMCYITCDLAEHNKRFDLIKYILLYQLMLLPFMYVMETVRSGMAFSLVVLMAYLEIVKNRRDWWIYFVYLLSIFIHNFAIVLVVARFACSFPKLFGKSILLLPMVVSFVITFLYSYINIFSGNAFLSTFIFRTYQYLTADNNAFVLGTQNNLFFIMMKITMFFEAVFALLISYYIMGKDFIKEKKHKFFLLYFNIINLLALSIMPFPQPLYWRFTSAGYSCCAALIIPFEQNYNRISSFIKITYYILLLFAIPSLILQLRWIPTYTDYVNWCSSIFLTNIYTVFYKVVTSII